jgi:hypothetical protein
MRPGFRPLARPITRTIGYSWTQIRRIRNATAFPKIGRRQLRHATRNAGPSVWAGGAAGWRVALKLPLLPTAVIGLFVACAVLALV